MSDKTLLEANIWVICGTGLVAGLLGSALGVGGGILIVPMFTLVLHLPIHVAIGSSLVAIVATSCTASSIYTKTRLTNIKLGLLLETATVPGAIVGALAAALLASSLLSGFFGVILIYTAYRMIIQKPAADGQTFGSPSGHLTASYYDQQLNKTVTYDVNHIPQGFGASFFGGALSGLLGIGGGIIKVPIMNIVMGLPMKAAIATSSYMIAITATVAALIHYNHGHIYPVIIAPLIIGVFIGARVGTRLAQRARGVILRRIFGTLLFVTSLLMLLQAVNIYLAT